MNALFYLMAETLPDWVTTLVPIVQKVLLVLLAVLAVAITILVLCQPSNSGGGVNALSGTTETYYAQNKGSSREGRLKKATTIVAIIMAVVTILYFVSLYIIPV